MKIGFVVLHYKNIEVTEKCIGLLLKQKGIEKDSIVVVDNASNNGSGEYLKGKFCNYHNIKFIINTENVGFAKGNNLGYKYARDVLKCNLIVVMNNDVYIEDNNFAEKVIELHSTSPDISIFAPDIYAMKGFYQNPLKNTIPSLDYVRKWYLKILLMNILVSVPVLGVWIANLIQIKHDANDAKKQAKVGEKRVKRQNIIPHGACIIFCPAWIEKEDVAFIPRTFMYCEEYLLSYYAKKNNHLIEYNPLVSVVHEAGASSPKVQKKDSSRKIKFFLENEMKSIRILYDMMK